MIIKLAKDVRLKGEDGVQFTLQVLRTKGEESRDVGEKFWYTLGYYGDLQSAMKGVLKHSVLSGKAEVSGKQLAQHVDMVMARIVSACEGVMSAKSAADYDGTVTADALDELMQSEVA